MSDKKQEAEMQDEVQEAPQEPKEVSEDQTSQETVEETPEAEKEEAVEEETSPAEEETKEEPAEEETKEEAEAEATTDEAKDVTEEILEDVGPTANAGPLAMPDKPSISEEEPVRIADGSEKKESAPPNLSGDKKIKTTVLGPMPVKEEEVEEVKEDETEFNTKIFALRTTANREDQVMSFVFSNAARKKLKVYAVIRPHGMRGYIFLEAETRSDAEQAAFGVPYARGVLPNEIEYSEIEHMLEQVKRDVNIKKNDIAEIISGPFKREKCKITRIDKGKEEVVVELLEAAVPIPMTMKMDSVKVIRRDEDAAEDKK